MLDGRNRYAACTNAGVERRFREYEGDNPLEYVLSANLHRRHLSTSQRALLADQLATLKHGQHAEGYDDLPDPGADAEELAEQEQAASSGEIEQASDSIDETIDASKEAFSSGDTTQSQAAELLKVSRSSVQRARIVRGKGTSKVIAAVEAGTLHINTAAQIARKTPQEQEEIMASDNPKAKVTALKSKADNTRPTVATLMKTWNQADEKTRKQFLSRIGVSAQSEAA